MPTLDERQQIAVRNALLSISKERLRVADSIQVHMHQAIKLRDVELELAIAYEELRGLMPRMEDPGQKKEGP